MFAMCLENQPRWRRLQTINMETLNEGVLKVDDIFNSFQPVKRAISKPTN